jgi:acyl carrier protein
MNVREDIRQHILAFVRRTANATLLDTGEPSDAFDLRRDGAIDSLNFIRLLSELEARTGTILDLSDVEPEKVTILGVLSTHIAHQLESKS